MKMWREAGDRHFYVILSVYCNIETSDGHLHNGIFKRENKRKMNYEIQKHNPLLFSTLSIVGHRSGYLPVENRKPSAQDLIDRISIMKYLRKEWRLAYNPLKNTNAKTSTISFRTKSNCRLTRLDLWLLQRDVAALLDVDVMSIVAWELGNHEPLVRHIPKIIEFLGVDSNTQRRLSFLSSILQTLTTKGTTVFPHELFSVEKQFIWKCTTLSGWV